MHGDTFDVDSETFHGVDVGLTETLVEMEAVEQEKEVLGRFREDGELQFAFAECGTYVIHGVERLLHEAGFDVFDVEPIWVLPPEMLTKSFDPRPRVLTSTLDDSEGFVLHPDGIFHPQYGLPVVRDGTGVVTLRYVGADQ